MSIWKHFQCFQQMCVFKSQKENTEEFILKTKSKKSCKLFLIVSWYYPEYQQFTSSELLLVQSSSHPSWKLSSKGWMVGLGCSCMREVCGSCDFMLHAVLQRVLWASPHPFLLLATGFLFNGVSNAFCVLLQRGCYDISLSFKKITSMCCVSIPPLTLMEYLSNVFSVVVEAISRCVDLAWCGSRYLGRSVKHLYVAFIMLFSCTLHKCIESGSTLKWLWTSLHSVHTRPCVTWTRTTRLLCYLIFCSCRRCLLKRPWWVSWLMK